VRAGDRVGAVGSTGHSTGPHLHYQVMKGAVAVDPLSYIADVVLTRDGESIRYQKGPSGK
jgi:murein DD-endopeptidase MepM/ murein hydrolase activator NlpD